MAMNEATVRRGRLTSRGRSSHLLLPDTVRARIIAGFGVVCVVFAAVAGLSVWQESIHRSDLRELDRHSGTATLLQESEAQVSIAALLLQRYVAAGDETYVAEIRDHSAAGVGGLFDAAARSKRSELQAISATGGELASGAGRVTALRQRGDVAAAAATLEEIVPVFRDFRLQLEDATAHELEQVSNLRASAERAGDRAFWLLAASVALGVAIALAASVIIVRSIIIPLSSLEATAVTASKGDLTVRAPATGPRELARVGEALNQMMATVEERTNDLRLSNEELWARNEQLTHARQQAASDALTGLLNHRKFHERIRELVLGAQENRTSVGLIMLDVDNFKQVNDRLGHQAGDQLLREIADALRDSANQDAYRYGGDEFAILLPEHNRERAATTAEALLRCINRQSDDAKVNISVSLGVAAFPESANSAEELIYRADMAMNWAKSAGKSRVGQWQTPMGSGSELGTPGSGRPRIA